MVNEPSRQPAARAETAEERRRRRAGAQLPGSAILAAALVTTALQAPKLPPFQGY
jgi:hypothetical protein